LRLIRNELGGKRKSRVGCAEVSWSGVRGKHKSRVGCAEVSWSGVRMELGKSARVEWDVLR
jgi:hypothetical protein